MGFGEWMQGAWNATGGQVFGIGSGGSTDEYAAQSQSVQPVTTDAGKNYDVQQQTVYTPEPGPDTTAYYDSDKTALVNPAAVSTDTSAPANQPYVDAYIPETRVTNMSGWTSGDRGNSKTHDIQEKYNYSPLQALSIQQDDAVKTYGKESRQALYYQNELDKAKGDIIQGAATESYEKAATNMAQRPNTMDYAADLARASLYTSQGVVNRPGATAAELTPYRGSLLIDSNVITKAMRTGDLGPYGMLGKPFSSGNGSGGRILGIDEQRDISARAALTAGLPIDADNSVRAKYENQDFLKGLGLNQFYREASAKDVDTKFLSIPDINKKGAGSAPAAGGTTTATTAAPFGSTVAAAGGSYEGLSMDDAMVAAASRGVKSNSAEGTISTDNIARNFGIAALTTLAPTPLAVPAALVGSAVLLTKAAMDNVSSNKAASVVGSKEWYQKEISNRDATARSNVETPDFSTMLPEDVIAWKNANPVTIAPLPAFRVVNPVVTPVNPVVSNTAAASNVIPAVNAATLASIPPPPSQRINQAVPETGKDGTEKAFSSETMSVVNPEYIKWYRQFGDAYATARSNEEANRPPVKTGTFDLKYEPYTGADFSTFGYKNKIINVLPEGTTKQPVNEAEDRARREAINPDDKSFVDYNIAKSNITIPGVFGYGGGKLGSGTTLEGLTKSNIGIDAPYSPEGTEFDKAGISTRVKPGGRKPKPTHPRIRRNPIFVIRQINQITKPKPKSKPKVKPINLIKSVKLIPKPKQSPSKIKQDLKSIINIEAINNNVMPKSLGKGFAALISPDKVVKSIGAHTKVKGTGKGVGKVKIDAIGLMNIKNITENINISGFGANLNKGKSGTLGVVGNINTMLTGMLKTKKVKVK